MGRHHVPEQDVILERELREHAVDDRRSGLRRPRIGELALRRERHPAYAGAAKAGRLAYEHVRRAPSPFQVRRQPRAAEVGRRVLVEGLADPRFGQSLDERALVQAASLPRITATPKSTTCISPSRPLITDRSSHSAPAVATGIALRRRNRAAFIGSRRPGLRWHVVHAPPALHSLPSLEPEEEDALQRAVRRYRGEIIAYEPAVKLGTDTGAVHMQRVATRRLRSLLRSSGPLSSDPERAQRLSEELRRLARALGKVRDHDVLIAYLLEELATLDEAAAFGAVLELLDD